MKTAKQILIDSDCYQAPINELDGRIISIDVDKFIKAMKIYANAKLEEAAEMATVKVSKGRNGCKMVVDTDSILQFKDQI